MLEVRLGDGSTLHISSAKEEMAIHLTKIVEGMVMAYLGAKIMATMAEEKAKR